MKTPRTDEEIERMVMCTRAILKDGQRRDRAIVEIMRLYGTLEQSERIDVVCEMLGIGFAELYEMVALFKLTERIELRQLAEPDERSIARWADDGGAPC